ncbi:50S ribosomal protein L4 [Pirellula sp. SH-Sr6A]|uniref:50S ribosomal protein L4 n=1 Tax=Pirellula sp. SH-Sr6A TaxID=1632865 RepID=UPI00078D9326|nr:50S ribosomal protein L4 [Pirellula sp. SH-Sr6A]AMV34485.1 50S ribosomal protein L4 [Pirellula sp. SH-Sr6A]
MTTLPVYDLSGNKVGDYEIDPASIAPKISKQLLHDVVVMYLANQRQGSNKTKTRGEVAGSTKKLYKQKGTGNARAGARRTPVRRGGGHANARQPRSYYYRLPRKAVQAATRMAIAAKISAGSVVVVDQLKMDAPKTKVLAGAFKALGLEGQTKTLAVGSLDRNVYLSGRNIQGCTISPVSDLNALVVLRPRKLVVTREALDWLKTRATA